MDMKRIKILGTGCPKCRQLADNAKTAVDQLDAAFEIEKITELNQIMQYGVMMTPCLVIDNQVKSSGKVPSVDQIKSMLKGV
jgi:small redox-active disulfide protein 2